MLRFKSAGRHELCHEDDILALGQRHLPVIVEAHDVRVL